MKNNRGKTMESKMTLSQKVRRLGIRLQDAEWRRYGTLLLLGKLVAISVLFLLAVLHNPDQMGLRAFADDPR